MTEALETVAKKKPEPSAGQAIAGELVRRVQERGLSLTWPDGLLEQHVKRACSRPSRALVVVTAC